MPFTENISAFFDQSGFGDIALIDGLSVNGIFNSGYVASQVSRFEIESAAPSFTCATLDLPDTISEGSTLVLNGSIYEVKDIEPQQGVTTLPLFKKTTQFPYFFPITL